MYYFWTGAQEEQDLIRVGFSIHSCSSCTHVQKILISQQFGAAYCLQCDLNAYGIIQSNY